MTLIQLMQEKLLGILYLHVHGPNARPQKKKYSSVFYLVKTAIAIMDRSDMLNAFGVFILGLIGPANLSFRNG